MPEMKVDCPRCGVKAVTADMGAIAITSLDAGLNANRWEAAGACRRCGKSSIFKLARLEEHRVRETLSQHRGNLHLCTGHWDQLVQSVGHVSLMDNAIPDVPEHLPDDIHAAFKEALVCIAVQCPNAAGAMFRLSLDLATKELLEQVVENTGLPAPHAAEVRLADRIAWLIENGHVPARLRGFANEVRLTGNDGAHDGSLEMGDALDLHDFSDAYMREMYTAQGRLAAVEARRRARRTAAK